MYKTFKEMQTWKEAIEVAEMAYKFIVVFKVIKETKTFTPTSTYSSAYTCFLDVL